MISTELSSFGVEIFNYYVTVHVHVLRIMVLDGDRVVCVFRWYLCERSRVQRNG